MNSLGRDMRLNVASYLLAGLAIDYMVTNRVQEILFLVQRRNFLTYLMLLLFVILYFSTGKSRYQRDLEP